MIPPPRRAWPFHLTVFIGAFLLFQVQPMLSKALLPGFGGSYLVWGAAMVFFQGVLLLGYAFAHGVQKRLGPVRYARLHPILLILPAFWLPFQFEPLMSDPGTTLPLVLNVLRLLLITAGFPFFVLSMTAVIIQRWFSVHPGFSNRNPYVLYSASNLGSLLALLSYPILVEPFFTLQQQAIGWSTAYGVLVILHLLCLPRPFHVADLSDRRTNEAGHQANLPHASRRQILCWFLLSTGACALLLAVTNVLTFDVAAVPFLWVLPLSVYLATFVLAFRPIPWFPPWIKHALFWAIPIGVLLDLMSAFRITPNLVPALGLHLAILFVVCQNTHVALVTLKPRNPAQLTTFYLILALGGFFGGILVSWLIPLVTSRLAEYLGSLLLCAVALTLCQRVGTMNPETRQTTPPSTPRPSLIPTLAPAMMALFASGVMPWVATRLFNLEGHAAWIITAAPLLLIMRATQRHIVRLTLVLGAVLIASFWMDALIGNDQTLLRHRNYYGIYRVFDRQGKRYLQHGTTLHGRQYLDAPASQIPSSYFHPTAPAGAILSDPAVTFSEIGMIGLGTGALAAYIHEGQSFTIFEIDADNYWIADHYFSYLDQARRQGARLYPHVGDGRLLLRRQADNAFDLLILDAFSSGSIPVHIITLEAFEEYFRTLRPNGLILLHISNRILDLEPLMFSIAARLGMGAASATNAGHIHPDADLTQWMALFRNTNADGHHTPWRTYLGRNGWRLDTDVNDPLPPPWTDRYSNLLRLLRRD